MKTVDDIFASKIINRVIQVTSMRLCLVSQICSWTRTFHVVCDYPPAKNTSGREGWKKGLFADMVPSLPSLTKLVLTFASTYSTINETHNSVDSSGLRLVLTLLMPSYDYTILSFEEMIILSQLKLLTLALAFTRSGLVDPAQAHTVAVCVMSTFGQWSQNFKPMSTD